MTNLRTLFRVGMILLSVFAVIVITQAQDATPTPEPNECEQFYVRGDESLAFLMGQANAQRERGNNETATALYTCVLDRDPNFIDAFLRRGLTHYEQGNFELARQALWLKKALEYNLSPRFSLNEQHAAH